jgi:hypothetical protein
MKRALFLVAVVTLVLVLSSCAEIIKGLLEGTPFEFRNRSSYVVNVFVDAGGTISDKTFTLKPGEDTEVYVEFGSLAADYTYTPSDLVVTDASGTNYVEAYYFWDKGKPRPY